MAGELNERVLPDDYPIYGDYLYVADGRVYRSDWHGITVRQLKGREGFSEVRNCDIEGRRALAKASPASTQESGGLTPSSNPEGVDEAPNEGVRP